MHSNTSTQVSAQERALISLMAAGAMFVAGYTVVRVNLAQNEPATPANVITNVVPGEGTLWADGF
ncbi:hypothetical protein IQ266_26915 [filamentous cyanobacterium LEGE 11480]|uniref:Uncharacterized protein n=1 Tax=Romeriopsis navalis LEGE 11480 TaxID=2777977 RepID=A0A928VUL8_9CYAN|nr:hypothetical protein [Romeriopsis navalis]MBE9033371.1 hypothetical protein [Romeriopsis navalis LEGE 11480]